MQNEFDVIHFHLGYLHFPIARRLTTPHVSTQHGRLDIPDLLGLYSTFRDVAERLDLRTTRRKPMPWMNWVSTVYHGLDPNMYRFHESPGKYFAFLGRISPEKRVDRAIAIAKRGRCAAQDRGESRQGRCRVLRDARSGRCLDSELIEYVGEIGEGEKTEFLGNAGALIFPIDWPEPFGLVMIESLACGTPVIAYRQGSVPEVLTHGVDGWIVNTIDEATQAAASTQHRAAQLPRDLRAPVHGSATMASNYVEAYERVIAGPSAPTPPIRLRRHGCRSGCRVVQAGVRSRPLSPGRLSRIVRSHQGSRSVLHPRNLSSRR